jgi:hypothetical protein
VKVPSGCWMACEIFCPPEIHLARPRAKTIIASVATKGWILKPRDKGPEASPDGRARGQHDRGAAGA